MYKICPLCRQEWLTREDFELDANILYLGDMRSSGRVTRLYNHETTSCGTTLAVPELELIKADN